MSELLKVNDNMWCLWSNIADGPTAWGTKDEIRAYLLREATRPPCPHCGYHEIDDRFDRAELHGTSMKGVEGPPEGFIYDQQGWLPWERLGDFLRSYDGKQFDTRILEPLDE